MRYSKVIISTGTARASAFGIRHTVLFGLVALGIAWAGVAFAQEAIIGHKLSQQEAGLRQQNAVLSAQNLGYRKDVQALTSGSANEEVARLNGYAKPSERLYLVTATPAATASPSPPAH